MSSRIQQKSRNYQKMKKRHKRGENRSFLSEALDIFCVKRYNVMDRKKESTYGNLYLNSESNDVSVFDDRHRLCAGKNEMASQGG
jgi:hypothetical protein